MLHNLYMIYLPKNVIINHISALLDISREREYSIVMSNATGLCDLVYIYAEIDYLYISMLILNVTRYTFLTEILLATVS